MDFSWHTIFDWLLKIIAGIGQFGEWLFTRVSLADATTAFLKVFSKPVVNDNPSTWDTIINTLHNFFEAKTPTLLDWAESVNFAPIDLIGITGLTIVVVMGFVKLFSIFA